MSSMKRASRFMVLLQIALFIVSAVIMSSSACLGAGIDSGTLNPNHPACILGRCAPRGRPYGPYSPYRPLPYHGAPPPNDGGIGRP
ncbi:unnamed protein product [Alopecurus aequalis]